MKHSRLHITHRWKIRAKAASAVVPVTQQVTEQHQLRELPASVTPRNKSPKFSNGGGGRLSSDTFYLILKTMWDSPNFVTISTLTFVLSENWLPWLQQRRPFPSIMSLDRTRTVPKLCLSPSPGRARSEHESPLGPVSARTEPFLSPGTFLMYKR